MAEYDMDSREQEELYLERMEELAANPAATPKDANEQVVILATMVANAADYEEENETQSHYIQGRRTGRTNGLIMALRALVTGDENVRAIQSNEKDLDRDQWVVLCRAIRTGREVRDDAAAKRAAQQR
jgi:hypothetical protein